VIKSLYNGISGISAHQNNINVWADNIANVNTPGYKTYNSPRFQNLFTQQVSHLSPIATTDVGNGVTLNPGTRDLSQGGVFSTDSVFNVAIDGNGWFGVEVPNGNGTKDIGFTRNGTFSVDGDGNLVDGGGHYVMGQYFSETFAGKDKDQTYIINSNKNIAKEDLFNISMQEDGTPTNQESIFLPKKMTYELEATKEVKLSGNIDLKNDVSLFETVILEADGKQKLLSISFSKDDSNTANGPAWNTIAKVKDDEGNTLSESAGVTKFKTNGVLDSSTLNNIEHNGIKININLGSGANTLTSSSSEQDHFILADGLRSGDLLNYSVNDQGIISANFDNDINFPVARYAVYHFINAQGLEREGGNIYFKTPNSGAEKFWAYSKEENGTINKETQRGARIKSGFLELSNLNLGEAMTQLIIAQRSYDANSKSITTSDDLLKTALGLLK